MDGEWRSCELADPIRIESGAGERRGDTSDGSFAIVAISSRSSRCVIQRLAMLSTDSLIGRSAAGRVCEFGLAAVIVCVLLLVLA